MSRSSIRWRLLAGIAAVQLLTGVAATLLVVHYEHQRAYAILESQIVQHAALVKPVIEPSNDPSSRAILHRELLTLPNHDVYVLNDVDGNTIAASGDWRPTGPRGADPQQFETMIVDGRHYRVLIEQGIAMLDEDPEERARLPKMVLYYGARIGGAEEHVERAGWTAAGLALLIMAISLAASAWVVRKELRPITELAARAAMIGPLNWEWDAKDSSREAEELAPLSNALTNLIQRLRLAFMREKQFTADAPLSR